MHVEFSNTVTIRRPPEEVFEFVSNLENIPRWNYAISETRKATEGPVRVGTIYHQVRSLPSMSEEALEVTELEPNRRFAVHGTLGPFVGTMTYDFEEDAGATRLTNSADLRARGVMKLAAPLASSRIQEAVGTNLRALRDLLEQPQS